jgi:predicted Zn-dependent protease
VLKIQSDIAANVARALSIRLGNVAQRVQAIGGTNNAVAQDLLLQATSDPGDDSEQALLDKIALFDRAIALDPNYAEAHARKSQFVEFWASTYATSVEEKERGQLTATQSAQRAIEIAPESALGYAALGAIHQDQLQLKRSLSDFQRADALSGANALAKLNYGLVLSQSRRHAEAMSVIERTIGLDPLNPLSHDIKALVLFYARRFAESIEAARQALRLAPQRNRAKGYLGYGLLWLGRADEAQREFQKMPADDYRRLVGEAAIAARAGRGQEALNAITAIERHYGDAAYYQFAQVYAQLGMVSEGVAALEVAWAKRDPGVSGIQVDPFIDPLRKDSRVAAIAGRVFG